MTSKKPALIMSTKDFFMAGNYGELYSKVMYGNKRKIIISGPQKSYCGVIPEEKFPQEFRLQKSRPHIALSEFSHVGMSYESPKVDMRLDEFVDILKNRGVIFEE